MSKLFCRLFATAALLGCIAVSAQDNKMGVESFTRDDRDQAARVTSPRKDQNNKICAIVKIETPLLLQDFTFNAGSVGIAHTEQKTGEIWVYLSPGTQRLTIQHKHLGVIRNYPFGESLKEATVYIMKLKSGTVKTVVEDDVTLQYLEVVCEVEGATITIDDEAPEPFTDGKFQKALSYGKHRYTVEAPMHHPESGVKEVTAQKAAPITVALKPKFGKLTISTQPEQGADVFVDDEKRGQSPLTLERIGSGKHKIRVIKPQFLPAAQEKTIADGATETLTLTMKPNFAVITLTAPHNAAIYVNDENVATEQWSGRLTSGQYKVEARKPSHRSSVATIAVKAGENKTIPLAAPEPVYGTLDVKEANAKATIFIDGENRGETPAIIKNVLVGSHSVELWAEGYEPYQQTVEVQEGKMLPLSATLQEEEKTGSLLITANISAAVSVDGKHVGYYIVTPITKDDVPIGEKKVSFKADGYKPLTKTVTVVPGITKVHAELEQKPIIHPVRLIGYRLSPPTSYFGLSAGYCKKWGGYLQFRVRDGNGDFSGGQKKYDRTSFTSGGMLRLFSFMYLYGGLGYGEYEAVRQVGEGADKVSYTSGLIKGLELEYGATFKVWKNFSVTAGYSTIAGSDFGELHFGVGMVLPVNLQFF